MIYQYIATPLPHHLLFVPYTYISRLISNSSHIHIIILTTWHMNLVAGKDYEVLHSCVKAIQAVNGVKQFDNICNALIAFIKPSQEGTHVLTRTMNSPLPSPLPSIHLLLWIAWNTYATRGAMPRATLIVNKRYRTINPFAFSLSPLYLHLYLKRYQHWLQHT